MVELSAEAVALLRQIIDTKDIQVMPANLEAYRELVHARIMTPMSGMVGGPETHFIFTESGWNRRAEWIAHPAESS